MTSIPGVPWQITGNHWLTIPCIHPADASIHCVSALHAGSRGSVEFAGAPGFVNGDAPPLFKIKLTRDGRDHSLGTTGIAWERESGWIPGFNCRIDELAVRGIICAPHGKNADLAGFVFYVTVANRGNSSADLVVTAAGSAGSRLLRVRTAREFSDTTIATRSSDAVVVHGTDARNPVAMAIGSDGDPRVSCEQSEWRIEHFISIEAGESRSIPFFVAAGQERDGAEAVLGVMRRRGAATLIESTRASLQSMEPSTGNVAADRLIGRHMFFAYFCSIARAMDDAHLYVMRSRVPWNPRGMTIRDWEALMWIMPAIQLADPALARDVLLRVCDLHGYAPGSGVHYVDGSLFEPGFALEGAAAFPIAVDEYIVQSGDDKVVEEPLLAESMYNAFEDIEARRHKTLPLYSTEVNADGSEPELPYTVAANTVTALALDILSRTLDEKTAEKVQDAAAVRAAVLRQFIDEDAGAKASLASSTDLGSRAKFSRRVTPSVYWLPYFDLLDRDDSIYRRTVKPLENIETNDLLMWCARLNGPNGPRALDWIRRAPLDGGFAAEHVDSEGRAIDNGGDAALSGLIAYTVWYAVHALGVSL